MCFIYGMKQRLEPKLKISTKYVLHVKMYICNNNKIFSVGFTALQKSNEET